VTSSTSGPLPSRERPARRRNNRAKLLGWLTVSLVLILIVLVVWSAFRATTFPVDALARSAPRRTAMMLQREAEARDKGRPFRIDERWVPYDRVSPLLRRAILVAEYAAFYQHGGLDWREIKESARKNLEKRRFARGGSTITQQLARNLFLGNEQTIARKLTEAFIAMRLEGALSKRRIFELYLNLIEWGDGIFGAEAAAERYFGIHASQLDQRQSILLAAVIINPRKYSVLSPQKRIESRVRMIAGRLRRLGYLDENGYRLAVGLPPVPAVDSGLVDTTGAEAPVPAEAPADTAPPAEAPEERAPAATPAPSDTSAPATP
jgi:monofunctional biosynthetic peptidoglycan transglycosylase